LPDKPFKVFPPFWRACLKVPVLACSKTPRIRLHPSLNKLSESLDAWQLTPRRPDWAAQFGAHWHPGERGARRALRTFLKTSLLGYDELRNRADHAGTSRLSPHLHFGEISPRQVWAQLEAWVRHDADFKADADKFRAELGWREFCHQLLYEFPQLPDMNWRREFDQYPWERNSAQLEAWQHGKTGYPMVDAGMRELWH